jgi:hypothetical protein
MNVDILLGIVGHDQEEHEYRPALVAGRSSMCTVQWCDRIISRRLDLPTDDRMGKGNHDSRGTVGSELHPETNHNARAIPRHDLIRETISPRQ